FAKESIDMSGSGGVIIDSYDSALGSYSNMTARSHADVMTNSTAAGAVELTGNVEVRGDVAVGAGGNPASGIHIGSNSSISGTTSAAPSNKLYESDVVPKSAVPMGDVVLDARDKLVLDGGVYVFDSLDMTGKS